MELQSSDSNYSLLFSDGIDRLTHQHHHSPFLRLLQSPCRSNSSRHALKPSPWSPKNGRDDDRLQAVPLDDGPHSREPSVEEVRRTIVISVSVCAFYITVSSSMVFVNKALSYTFNFRTINSLLFMQMIFTIFFLRTARDVLRIIDFPDLEYRRARQVIPVSFFYSLNAAVALVALRELSVPSYTMVKRLAPLFTLSLEAVLLRKRPTVAIIFALAVMAVGTVLAAKADTGSSTWGWFLGFGSCLFQALYLTFVKRSGIDTGLSSFGILYYHSILSLPFISIIVLGVGEIPKVLVYDQWFSPSFFDRAWSIVMHGVVAELCSIFVYGENISYKYSRFRSGEGDGTDRYWNLYIWRGRHECAIFVGDGFEHFRRVHVCICKVQGASPSLAN